MGKLLIGLLALAAAANAQFGNASRLRGVNIKATLACSDAQVITYVAANSQFECVASAGSGTVSSGTANQVAKYAANGTTVSGSSILSDDASIAYVAGPLDIKTNGLVIEIPNSGSPGTTVNKLAKIPAGVASVLTTSSADVISAIGIVIGGAGTTGSAKIGVLGQFSCLFDTTATTAGDFVTPSSTTAGTCHDAGSTYPTTGQVMGQVLSSNASCGSPPCGPYTVLLGTPDVFLPGSGGSNGGGGGGAGNRSFSGITSGTNSAATMTVGTGSTLTVSGSGTNNANQFKGNATVAVADGGTGLTSAWTRTAFITAAECNNATASPAYDLPTSNAPAATCFGTSYRFGALAYDDAANETATFYVPLPTGWTGNIDFTGYAFVNATSQSVKLTVATICIATSEDILNPTFNSAQTITVTTPGTANQLFTFSQSAMTTTGCAAGETLVVKVGRDVTDTSTATFNYTGTQLVIRVTPQA